MVAVGIDLGTTHSLLGVCDADGDIGLVAGSDGAVLTPSVVGLSDDDAMLVGAAAAARRINHPDRTIAAFKRSIGAEKIYRLGGQNFDASQLSALVLRKLAADLGASAYAGSIDPLVISVPAYFNAAQREATMLAAELAGLPRPRLINEPTAAALAYGLHDKDMEQTIVVLDLGGGTFDVSIVEMFEGVMEVRSSAGDAMLGGEDFTRLIAEDMAERFGMTFAGAGRAAQAQLVTAAEQVKRHLSRAEVAEVDVALTGRAHHYALDRTRFEELSAPLLLRMRRPVERCLYDAKLAVDDVDRVVLVGGATRMPMIRSLAARLLRKLPEGGLDPDEVVARGAAVQAGLVARNAALSDMVMTDVTPFTLGIASRLQTVHGVIEDGFSPIIERNTILPASRVRRFFTAQDRQKEIALRVLQGESPLASDNVKIGEMRFAVPPAPAGQEAIDVRFSHDSSGLLHVEVTTVSSGYRQEMVIEGNAATLSPAERAARLAALDAYKVHPRDQEENLAVLESIKEGYAMTLGEDRERMADLLARFEKLLAGQDTREIQRLRPGIVAELDAMLRGYVR